MLERAGRRRRLIIGCPHLLPRSHCAQSAAAAAAAAAGVMSHDSGVEAGDGTRRTVGPCHCALVAGRARRGRHLRAALLNGMWKSEKRLVDTEPSGGFGPNVVQSQVDSRPAERQIIISDPTAQSVAINQALDRSSSSGSNLFGSNLNFKLFWKQNCSN